LLGFGRQSGTRETRTKDDDDLGRYGNPLVV